MREIKMENEMNIKQDVLDGLKPLFEKAEKDGLWFRWNYQGIVFSPDELMERHKKGTFISGAVNWTLINPHHEIEKLKAGVEDAKNELRKFEARVYKWENRRSE
jgi:hypothetical protein